MTEELNMLTITLSDSLSKEIDKVAHEFGFTEKQFIEDILREKILEYKKRLFVVKGAADIRRKLELKNYKEAKILAEFERFRHSQSEPAVS